MKKQKIVKMVRTDQTNPSDPFSGKKPCEVFMFASGNYMVVFFTGLAVSYTRTGKEIKNYATHEAMMGDVNKEYPQNPRAKAWGVTVV